MTRIATITTAALVGAAMLAAVIADIVVAPRPKGGWVYDCRASTPLRGGFIAARRTVAEHGEGQLGNDVIGWLQRDVAGVNVRVMIEWYEGRSGKDPTKLDGLVQLSLKPQPAWADDDQMTLSRISDVRSTLSADFMSGYRTGNFQIAKLLAFAGGENRLAWRYAGKSAEDGPLASGMLDMAAIRQAITAMPVIARKLDGMAAQFATACARRPANALAF